MSRVLVTGASGHIGAHIVRVLLARGHHVAAFVRPGSKAPGLRGLNVLRRDGDLLDAAAVEKAMEGTELVFHAGAVHRNWSRNPDDIIRPAVEGTRNVLEAARKLGVKRVVVTSSIAAVGYTPDAAKPYDETHRNEKRASAYIRAKCEEEELAFELGGKLGLEIVAVCPTGVFGPLDYKLTPATRALRDIVDGGPVVMGVNVVHVHDVAEGHALAAEKGRPGERYLLGGDNLLPAELAAAVGKFTGQPPKVMSPPLWLMGLLARAQVLGARLSGKDPALTPDMVRDAGGRHLLYDVSKARRELGFAPRGAEAVLIDALRWLRFVRALRPATVRRLGEKLPSDPSWSQADETA